MRLNKLFIGLLAVFMLICIDVGCKAQTHFGFTVGLQPTLQNEMNQIVSEEIDDLSVLFLKRCNLGTFLRIDIKKYFYVQVDVNASIESNWNYVSEGNSFTDKFSRAFENHHKIKFDIPIYLGGYLVKQKYFSMRLFASPQFKIWTDKDLEYGIIDFKRFSINMGLGFDILKYLTFNVNYRTPIDNGNFLFDNSRISATLGIIF
jgi:hypothetical protein